MTLTVDLVEANRSQGRVIDDHFLYKAWERTNQALWHMPRNVNSILDIGCADGRGTSVFRFAYPNARIEGMEGVPERAEMARKWCDRVHTCFLQDADFNAGSFDVVYSGEVVEHVPYEDADAFIAAYARVLKPGGVAILTTPNPNYIRLWLTGRKVTDDPSHFSEWSVTNLRRLVEKHGLKFRLAQGTGRMARKLGTALPVSPFYGSYMLVAEKP